MKLVNGSEDGLEGSPHISYAHLKDLVNRFTNSTDIEKLSAPPTMVAPGLNQKTESIE